MASSSGGRKKRLVSSLDGEVLMRLSMKMNPTMLLKDYRLLAGKMKYTYEYIRNFARDPDPTLALLQHWWSNKRGNEKTVSILIGILSDMERDDAVELLRPYEFYSSKEAAEYDENLTRPVTNADRNRDPGRENDSHQNAAVPKAYPQDTARFQGHLGRENAQNERTSFNISNHGNHFQNSNTTTVHADVHGYGSQFSERQDPAVFLGHPGRENAQNQRASFSGNYKPNSSTGPQSSGFSRHEDKLGHQRTVDVVGGASSSAGVFREPPGQPLHNPQFQPSRLGSIDSLYSPSSDREYEPLDGFHGAKMRRDLRLLGPQTLDGSSASSTDGGVFRGHPGQPPRNPHFQPPRLGSIDSFYLPSSDKKYEPSDGFSGARRDIRVHGLQRPQTLDGSSASSFDGEYYYGTTRVTQGPFNQENLVRDFGEPHGSYHEQYRGSQGLAAAEGHNLTAATDKIALVIGNQDYVHRRLKGLQYPQRDAAGVAEALIRMNFKVVSLVNLTHGEMRTAMLAFCCLLGRGVYGVVYFAGHGYEDNGETFLLPVDSDLQYNREHSLRVQEILEAMQQCDTSLNLLIIDACRVSLPNRCGITVPRVKRDTKGNNIFAYSCCSQQESLEEPNCRNGMYCSHLLRRLRENKRVEHMLMDVASDFARTYSVDLEQRPCIETDCMMDFRLTDPIQREFLGPESAERLRRWEEARRFPEQFSIGTSHIQFVFKFQAPFCNVLRFAVIASELTGSPVTQLNIVLHVKDPLHYDDVDYQELTGDEGHSVHTFQITNVQKMYKLQEPLILSFMASFTVDGELTRMEKNIDLGWPIVSSVMCLWDSWLLGDKYKSTSV